METCRNVRLGVLCGMSPRKFKELMTAVRCRRYGPPEVLELVRVPKPTPRPDEICIRIHASAATQSDAFIRSAAVGRTLQVPFRLMIGISRPRVAIVGFVFSGVVEAAGPQTTRFAVGDEVYGMTGFRLGAYAQYRCMRESDSKKTGTVGLKPSSISHEEATAVVYGGSLAVQYTDRGNIRPGRHVLIYGASGTSGTIAVQYAKSLGAHVTAVCSTANVDFVESLGADEVLDYTQTDAPPEGTRYDFVLDSVGGAKTSKLKEACRAFVKDGGTYVSIDDGNLELNSDRLEKIRGLVESGDIKPVVGSTFELADIAEAHRLVDTKHKRGGIAIVVP